MTDVVNFPKSSKNIDELKAIAVAGVVASVSELFETPNSTEHSFGVAAELANAFTGAVIRRIDDKKMLSEDDRAEIAAVAGTMLDKIWVVHPVRRTKVN